MVLYDLCLNLADRHPRGLVATQLLIPGRTGIVFHDYFLRLSSSGVSVGSVDMIRNHYKLTSNFLPSSQEIY